MRVPRYRKQHGRDWAFVEHQGERHRLPGRFNSPESRDAYKQFLGRVLGQAQLPQLIDAADTITVQVLVAAFLQYAQQRYPNGTRGEWANCKYALRHLLNRFGPYLATGFGPLRLKELQRALVAEGREPSYVNQCCNKIKRAFKWAASEELVPITTYQALLTVTGVSGGKRKKRPVARADVDAIKAKLSPTIGAMAEFQWHTGARSGSIVMATPGQFQQDGELLLWRPRHKQEHTSEDLVLPIGPRCQAVLKPFLDARKSTEYLFNPQEARGNRRYGVHYSSATYRQALQRAIDQVNEERTEAAKQAGVDPVLVPRWSPHRLRHSKGHAVRNQYGAEAAQAVLGHESLDATQIYSGRRLDLAKSVAKETG